MAGLTRRNLLGTGALAAGALAFGPSFWRAALAAPATPGPGPYGPLGPFDANGISLPAGFSAREIARAGQPVAGTAYPWHIFPDGQATYAVVDGGWVLVSNSESIAISGAGSSAIRFGPDGTITDAYRVLAGTNVNCAGGRTPWGTWLSCEEHDGGQVWECDPLGGPTFAPRPALGFFKHEAAAVDPIGKHVYMTEDTGDGCFYRFTPAAYPDLTSGTLEVLVGSVGSPVTWARVNDPSTITGGPTRNQVPGAARFSGGEGIWYDGGLVLFSTKGENRIYSYDTRTSVLEVLFDGNVQSAAGLKGLDNLTVSQAGDLFVCEDNGEAEYSIGIISREREAARFLTVSGPIHSGSELAGVIFDPSGSRMYVASQRAQGGQGAVYEVTGPFRTDPPPGAEPNPPGEPAPLDPGQRSGPLGPRGGAMPGVGSAPGGGAGGAGAVLNRVRIGAARRVSVSALLRRGVAVNVAIDRPGTVALALRTADLAREPGERGSSDRPVLVTLARVERTFTRAGRYKIRLKPGARARRLLRAGGTLDARYTAQLREASGDNQVVGRAVSVAGARARR